jgi:hypothetical protein
MQSLPFVIALPDLYNNGFDRVTCCAPNTSVTILRPLAKIPTYILLENVEKDLAKGKCTDSALFFWAVVCMFVCVQL